MAIRQHGALTYALRKSSEIPVDDKSWPTFQALVWNAVSVEPTTMAVALDLLDIKGQEANSVIDKLGAAEVIESLIGRNAPLRNASEVAWALWAAIQFEVQLSRDAAALVTAMEHDFVALLALDANSRGRFPARALDTTPWETLIDYDEVLHGAHWLLAYEATTHGMATGDRDPGSGGSLLRRDRAQTGAFLRSASDPPAVHRTRRTVAGRRSPRLIHIIVQGHPVETSQDDERWFVEMGNLGVCPSTASVMRKRQRPTASCAGAGLH